MAVFLQQVYVLSFAELQTPLTSSASFRLETYRQRLLVRVSIVFIRALRDLSS